MHEKWSGEVQADWRRCRICQEKLWIVWKFINENELPPGFALLQKIEPCFGTTQEVVERFLKSVFRIKGVSENKTLEGATKDSQLHILLYCFLSKDNEQLFYTLETIARCYILFWHPLTSLEAIKRLNTLILLPTLKQLKRDLQLIADRILSSKTLEMTNFFSKSFAWITIEKPNKVFYHDLSIAAWVLLYKNVNHAPNCT